MRTCELRVSELQAKQFASCILLLDQSVSFEFESTISLRVAGLVCLHIASSQ